MVREDSQNYKIELYSLDVDAGEFVKKDILSTFTSLRYANFQNAIGYCQFVLNIGDIKATTGNLQRWVTQIVIKRGGQIVWFGPLTNVSGAYGDVNGSIIVYGLSYLAHLRTRFTGVNQFYTQEDQSDIAWDLINTTQSATNGTLLISRGADPSGTPRDRSYSYMPLSDALINLSNVINGVDFSFDAATTDGNLSGVTFNVYSPRVGTKRDDLPTLEIGKNVNDLKFDTTSDIVNSVTAVGFGTGEEVITYSKELEDMELAFTRREEVLSLKTVKEEGTLEDHVDAYLTAQSPERYNIRISLNGETAPKLGEYILGDSLILNLHKGGYVNFEGEAKVTGIVVDVDSVGGERVQPDLLYLE